MNSREQFIKIVLSTTIFTDEEKVALVEAVDSLNEEARADIIKEVEGYDQRTKERVNEYKNSVKDTFEKYRKEITDNPEIDPKDKDKARATSRVLEDAITKAANDITS